MGLVDALFLLGLIAAVLFLMGKAPRPRVRTRAWLWSGYYGGVADSSNADCGGGFDGGAAGGGGDGGGGC